MRTITSCRPILLCIIVSIFFLSCRKDLRTPFPGLPPTIPVGGPATTNGIPAYTFNWWSVDYMPVPASYTGSTIYPPWANGSVQGFSTDIRYDMQPTDGWVLVYNQFDPTKSSLPANPLFILYNKYRGLLRIYIYVTTNGFQNSDYLTSGMSLAPNSINSSMLNFVGKDIVDIANKTSATTKIEPTQIATNTWYASQYEIAYDPNVAGSTLSQLGMNWTLKWTNITQVKLEGTAVGTLNGTISTPASGFSLSGLASNAAVGALEATGLAVFNNNAGNNGVGNGLGLPVSVFNAAKSGLTDALSGTVKNIFNSILGSGGSSQNVNLSLNAKITLTGSLTAGGALIPDPGLALGVPGVSNSQTAQGLVPYYNTPMGIFNLSSRPTVNMTTTYLSDGTLEGSSTTYTFALDDNSFQIIYNPAVLSEASIQNVFEEVMVTHMTWDNLNRMSSEVTDEELIGNIPAFGAWYINVPAGMGPPLEVVVRIRFTVVPNNGSQAYTIVKTFLANVVNQ